MSISISEFRSLADALGRFANVRETAKNPEDRVLIMDDGRRSKFIAGTASQVLVHYGPTFGGGRALVASRLLLTHAKALRGKGEVSLEFDGIGGLTMTTPAGGKAVLPCLATSIPDWPVPPSEGEATTWARLPKGALVAMAKFAAGLTAPYGHRGFMHLSLDCYLVTAVIEDGYTYVEFPLPTDPVLDAAREYRASVPLSLLIALRFHDGPASLLVRDGMAIVEGDNFYAYAPATKFDLRSMFVPVENIDTLVRADRKSLASAIKAVGAPQVSFIPTLNGLTVAAGAAAIEVDATVTAVGGRVSVGATKFLRILDALGGEDVAFGFNGSAAAALCFKETTPECRVFLAPVVT